MDVLTKHPSGTSQKDIPQGRPDLRQKRTSRKYVPTIRPEIIYPFYKIYIFHEGIIFDNKGNQERLAVIFNKINMNIIRLVNNNFYKFN